MTTTNIYEVRAFGQFVRRYATLALVAQALGVTEAYLIGLAQANIAEGRPPSPISATVPVNFTGVLTAVDMPATADVQVSTIAVVTTYP